jgi:lysophospholipase L1-like esterase
LISIAIARTTAAQALSATPPADNGDLRFDFYHLATAIPPPFFRGVWYSELYSKDRGYGFEPGSKIEPAAHSVTSDGPFYFSVAVPEGNYRVTVTLGDSFSTHESTTTVKAELRRLMLDRIHTDAGQTVTRSFIVNVRTPVISTGGQVHLKPRERTTEWGAWDEKLTLEFIGDHPSVSTVQVSRADDVPTIYLIGDSTVTDQPREPYNSWGQMLTAFFTPDVAIANDSESGETTSSFLAENRWAKVLGTIKPRDWVLMQFGHNDEKDRGPTAGAYNNYTANLSRFVQETRDHGATPVILTPVARRRFDDTGKSAETHGDYPAAARKVANDKDVALIDLSQIGMTLYDALGPRKSVALFATPKEATHHSDYGSWEIAKCVVEGIKQNNLEIAKYLRGDPPPFDPAHPDPIADFNVPAEPLTATTKPYGS